MSIEIKVAIIGLAATILTVGASLLGSWWMVKALLSRVPSQNQNDAANTAATSLKMADEALKMAQESQRQNKEILDRLAGLHRLTVDFDMQDLLKDGKALIHFGQIEVVKAPVESDVV